MLLKTHEHEEVVTEAIDVKAVGLVNILYLGQTKHLTLGTAGNSTGQIEAGTALGVTGHQEAAQLADDFLNIIDVMLQMVT